MKTHHIIPCSRFKFESRNQFSYTICTDQVRLLLVGIDVINVKNILVDSVCILSPVSDILPPPNILLAAIGTPFWKSKQITVSMNTNLKKTSNKPITVLSRYLPLQRRTISWRAPMVPSMASSSRAFMSWDFLNVRLLILSRAFFPYNNHHGTERNNNRRDQGKTKQDKNKSIKQKPSVEVRGSYLCIYLS